MQQRVQIMLGHLHVSVMLDTLAMDSVVSVSIAKNRNFNLGNK